MDFERKNHINKNSISAIFYDCDGVLTDNRVLLSEDGKEAVFFNRGDGLAVNEFRKLGIHQAIISTETNDVVKRRAEKLKIPVIYRFDTYNLNKGTVLREYANNNNIDLQHAIFIGNDINDLPALEIVGFPCAPIDAEEEVVTFVELKANENGNGLIIKKKGGDGVVRELYRYLES